MKKKGKENEPIPGQISLFDYLKEKAKASVVSFASAKERVFASVEEYLKRGEILSTLARERFERVLKLYTFNEVEERIYQLKAPNGDLTYRFIPELAKQIVRPLLRKLSTFDENDEAYQILLKLVDVKVTIEAAKGKPLNGALQWLNYREKKTDDIICLTVTEEGFEPCRVYGYRCYSHGKRSKNLHFRDNSVCADLALVYAWLIALTLTRRAMGTVDLRPMIAEQWEEKNFNLHCQPLAETVHPKELQAYFDGLKEMFADPQRCVPVMVPFLAYKRPSEEALSWFCALCGVEKDAVKVAQEDHADIRRKHLVALHDSGGKKGYCVYVDKHIELALLWYGKFLAWERGIGHFSYNDLLERVRAVHEVSHGSESFIHGAWALPNTSHEFLYVMEFALAALFHENTQAVKTAQYMRELKKTSRARVYMTKKNIPKKIVDEMQKSAFNDYFGYVEFDELVDVAKAKVIADEFIAFRETYLKNFDTKGVSLRFRRLGNHKATGLYFPNINCLCVDVSSPSSFLHEYGHCLDYLNGKGRTLSDEGGFFAVYSRYARALKEELAKNEHSGMRKKLAGRSKYNLDYYLLHTEAFARCFEIYCTKVLKIRNSICKQEDKMRFAYPQDERLLELVKDYYDRLFSSLNGGEVRFFEEEGSDDAVLAA